MKILMALTISAMHKVTARMKLHHKVKAMNSDAGPPLSKPRPIWTYKAVPIVPLTQSKLKFWLPKSFALTQYQSIEYDEASVYDE